MTNAERSHMDRVAQLDCVCCGAHGVQVHHLREGQGMSQIFRLVHETARKNAARTCLSAPDGYVVKISEPTRSLDQNALLWPVLQEISNQVVWYGQKLTKEEWKDVLSASLKKQKAVPGIDGGFVVCGQSTSKMTKREFSDLLELCFAFGAQQGVTFSDRVAA